MAPSTGRHRQRLRTVERLEDRCLPSYTVTDLGTLGGSETIPAAINNAGQIAGSSTTATTAVEHAVLYSDGVLTDLGSLGGKDARSIGLAIDPTGQVVGYAEVDGDAHAFLYDGGTMTDLGTIGGHLSYAYGINGLGLIVGASSPADDSTLHATLFNRRGTVLDLDPNGVGSIARAVNDLGEVVGQRGLASGQYHAFLYEHGAFADLGSLGGSVSDAYAVNDLGQAVGFADLASGTRHACLFSAGAVTDLGTLGGTTSGAYGINNEGQIVGFSQIASPPSLHAALFQDGQVTDLNTFLPPDFPWTLTTANAVNDAGQIVATGKNAQGDVHGFLLTPDDAAAAVGPFHLPLQAELHHTNSFEWPVTGRPANAIQVVERNSCRSCNQPNGMNSVLRPLAFCVHGFLESDAIFATKLSDPPPP